MENPAHPVRYQGVVCSLKESFGFIERGDVVREIFFHFSEAKGIADTMELGDDVEFTIQTRNVCVLFGEIPRSSLIQFFVRFYFFLAFREKKWLAV